MKRFLSSAGLLWMVLASSLALGAQGPPSNGAGKVQQPQLSSPASTAGSASRSLSNARSSSAPVESDDQGENAQYLHSASVRLLGRWLHLSPEVAAWLFEYLNFAILVGALLFLLVKYVPGLLRTRREAIQKQLVEARAATEQAKTRLQAVEGRFAKLDQEIAGIRAQAEQEGLAEEVRIKALIEAERQRIVASAEQEIRAAASAARRELKRFAGELAVDRAEAMISLPEQRDRALVRQFSEELGQETRNGDRN